MIGKAPTVIIKEFDNEIQALFRIKQRCDLKGIRDTISGATESIKEFHEIRDSSLVKMKKSSIHFQINIIKLFLN